MIRFLTVAMLVVTPASAQDRIPSHCIALAQNDAQMVQVAFGDPLAADSVRLRYVDHATFLLETPGGLTVATDYTGFLGSRDVVPDVVTMNNAHSTHWTSNPDPRIPHVLRGWADAAGPAAHSLDLGEMLVRNVTTDVRSRFGDDSRGDGNSIFIFEVAGLCVGHLGHLHHVPDDAQFASIGRLDVVMVPVDGGFTMNVADMADVVRRLRSSVVVPMHWFSGASLEVFLTEMAGQFDVVRPEMSEIELSLDNLPRRPTIMVLEPEYLQ
jgi:L-ascorbate metabolism protein UlaG (beta-lactamase superfamily)